MTIKQISENKVVASSFESMFFFSFESKEIHYSQLRPRESHLKSSVLAQDSCPLTAQTWRGVFPDALRAFMSAE